MRAVFEARGGNLDSLLKDFVTFLSKFPWLRDQLIAGNHIKDLGLNRLIRAVEDKLHSKDQVFVVVINAIVNLELFISSQLIIFSSSYPAPSLISPDPFLLLNQLNVFKN